MFDEIFENLIKEIRAERERKSSITSECINAMLHDIEKDAEKQKKSVYDFLCEGIDEAIKVLPIDIRAHISVESKLKPEDFKGLKKSTVEAYFAYKRTLYIKYFNHYISVFDKNVDNILKSIQEEKSYEDMTKEELIAELNKRK